MFMLQWVNKVISLPFGHADFWPNGASAPKQTELTNHKADSTATKCKLLPFT